MKAADPGATHTVVIILPGGRARGRSRFRSTGLANLRMIPVGWVVRRATRGADVAVWRLGYRFNGWNGADRDLVRPGLARPASIAVV